MCKNGLISYGLDRVVISKTHKTAKSVAYVNYYLLAALYYVYISNLFAITIKHTLTKIDIAQITYIVQRL